MVDSARVAEESGSSRAGWNSLRRPYVNADRLIPGEMGVDGDEERVESGTIEESVRIGIGYGLRTLDGSSTTQVGESCL